LCLAGSASAADLTLAIQCDGVTTPGGAVDYTITGVLTNTNNEGLALFGFDMSVSGPAVVTLSSATTVNPGSEMGPFVANEGLNNPAGFGGTPGSILGPGNPANDLLQIGGGQNTIANPGPVPPAPVGTVVTGIGQTEVVLATGTLTMPGTAGTYTLTLSGGFANVIKQGETGPVYAVEAAGSVTGASCEILVGHAITGVQSVLVHSGTPFGIALDQPNFTGVEPRQPGPTTLEVTFSGNLDAGTVNPSNVAIQDEAATPYAGVIGTSSAANVLTITLSPALPNLHCYTVDLDGMQAEGGDLVLKEFHIVALKGDVSLNSAVNSADKNLVVAEIGTYASAATAKYDYDTNGAINSADKNLVTAQIGTSSPSCP